VIHMWYYHVIYTRITCDSYVILPRDLHASHVWFICDITTRFTRESRVIHMWYYHVIYTRITCDSYVILPHVIWISSRFRFWCWQILHLRFDVNSSRGVRLQFCVLVERYVWYICCCKFNGCCPLYHHVGTLTHHDARARAICPQLVVPPPPDFTSSVPLSFTGFWWSFA
jgi:hypothetical protein